MKHCLLPALAFALTVPAAALAATTTEPVAFESFTYTGRDAIFESPLPAGHSRNPILAGYYPDPSICRVPGKSASGADDYYLVNSTFAHFPGLPIFHSRDLVNWRQLGHVIDRPAQLKYEGLRINEGLYAPAISHHEGVFYVICTMIGSGGNFLVTATDPAGPWSDPVWLHFDGIDPSLFFDDDGRAWIVNNGNPPDNQPLYSGHRAIWIQEFDVAAKKMVGPRSIIVNGGVDLSAKPVWIEGPHLYKRDGWYYLCCAEGGTSVQHSQVILRSRSVTGPFVPWDRNPILTQRDLDNNAPHAVTCTGHADLEIGPDGNWWAVFLACRPYAPDRWATGRETFLLPVKWTEDGWPQILPPGERVPQVVKAPVGPALAAGPRPVDERLSSVPLTGNFTWTDEFDSAALSPLWIMLRAPKANWWRLADGQLALTPRPELLSGKSNPSFLGRRVQHARFDASTTLAVPATPGVAAGLVVIQNEKQYFTYHVERTGDSVRLTLTQCHQGKLETLAQRELPAAGKITLQLHADATRYTFAFACDGGAPQTLLADVDSYPASVQAAGGGIHFTGALVGVHATRP